MIIHTVDLTVANARAVQLYDFMIDPADERYSAWWPGEHLRFHIVKRGDDNHIGDVVFMDEYLGKNHRLVFHAVVVVAERPHKIKWQMKKAGIKLPAWVTLELLDSDDGIKLRHELRIGFSSIGKLFDPIIRLYFSKSFQNALYEHCKLEWDKLAKYLT